MSVWRADVTSLPHCDFLFSLSAPSGGHSKDVVISVGCPVLPREDLPPGGGGGNQPLPLAPGLCPQTAVARRVNFVADPPLGDGRWTAIQCVNLLAHLLLKSSRNQRRLSHGRRCRQSGWVIRFLDLTSSR